MAGLITEKVDIPLARGVNEAVHERVAPVDKLLVAENCEWTKLGGIKKRHGFSVVGTTSLVNIRGLFSTGKELCCTGSRTLRAYEPVTNAWLTRGNIAPCAGQTRSLFRDLYDYRYCDLDCDADQQYVMVAGQRREIWGEDPATDPVERGTFAIYTLPDWQVLHEPELSPNGTHGQKHKVAHCPGFLLCVAHAGVASSTLYMYQWDMSTPYIEPDRAIAGDVSTCYFSNEWRTYDICAGPGVSNYDYFIAWVRNSEDYLDIQARRSTHGITAAAALGAGADLKIRTAAISYDRYCGDGALWVLLVKESTLPATLGQCSVVLYRLSSDLSSVDWSRIIWTGSGGGEVPADNVHTLGVVCGPADGAIGPDLVVCVWSTQFLDDASGFGAGEYFQRTYSAGLKLDGSTQSDVVILRNESLLTKPWCHTNRVYITTTSDFGRWPATGRIEAYMYVTNLQFELCALGASQGNEHDGMRYKPAGIHDVGTGSPTHGVFVGALQAGIGEGAAQNVAALSTTKVAYANHSRSTTTFYATGGAAYWDGKGRPQGWNHRRVDSVELDYGYQPQAARAQNGQVLVSGAYSVWYDGADCFESHIPVPPVILKGDGEDTGPGTFVGPVANKYVPVWIARTESGSVYRSVPGPWIDVDIENPEDAARLWYRTLGWTSHWFEESLLTIALYRADASDGTYRRCNPFRLTRNDDDEDWVDVYDFGDTLGETLYTLGNVLENACPEGFRWCLTANERIWTAGHFRGVRCQFSNRQTPGTGTELSFIPTFHESNGFIYPDGDDASGIGRLDEKVILFTNTAVYAVAGLGPADDGSASDFSQLTLLTDTIGCDDGRSVVSFPGGVAFLGNGTIQFLTRTLEIKPAGQVVRGLLGAYPTIVSADCLSERFQLLFAAVNSSGEGIIIVYDYRLDEWCHWIPHNPDGTKLHLVDACVHKGEYYVAESDEVYKYDTSVYKDCGEQFIVRDVVTAHIQTAGLNGWQRVKEWMLHAEYVDEHKAKVTVYNDFNKTVSQTHTWDDDDLSAFADHADAGRIRLRQKARVQKCQSIQLRYQDEDDLSTSGQSSILYGWSLLVASKPTLTRVRADQQA